MFACHYVNFDDSKSHLINFIVTYILCRAYRHISYFSLCAQRRSVSGPEKGEGVSTGSDSDEGASFQN